MNYLSAENLSKSYNDRWLFQDLTIGISQGDKIALVGENGVGKSTLLKLLIGQEPSDSGKISVRDGVRIGDLVQQPHAPGHLTVKDILFDEKNKIAAVVKEYESVIHDPGTSPEKMQTILEKMEENNAWEYDSLVHEVTSKLGITNLEQRFEELSGGQRKRTFLAQMLLTSPDLLIMDEPTNHLDLEAIEWLENYLSGQNITLLMVTHDRYFLDNVANLIIEIDRGKLYTYRGNYAYFLEKKSAREDMLKTEVAKARNLMKKELEWMRKQPKARGTKAKYRIEAFYELQEKASVNLKKDKLELDIQERRQGGKILELHHVSKNYGTQKMVDNFSYIFKKNDRIGVVGKNGIGKSTFLDLLIGKKPDAGEIIPGITTKIGYFTQEAASLNPAHRVIEEVKTIAEYITLADGSQVSASKFLDLFLFPPEKQYTFVEKLSGGEKKRLQLLKVLVTNPNFLILDEPTNDFDIDTLNVLEDFLEKFNGCLVLVSHDRYFMDHLVNQLFVFEGDGKVRLFNGNYSDYRSWLEETELSATTLKKEKPEPVKEIKNSQNKITFKEKQEYEKLTSEIEILETKKNELTAQLNSGSTDHLKLTEIAQHIEAVTHEIEVKTNRWLQLASLI
ncbi:MAG: Bis-ABC ATPase Uup [Cytophagales bacterium]|nr:ABC-F family ATP-binding cassette domain-containing protein [Bacteroidota bacterium]MBS1981328.1 ABC-F family ATP-binding cassette domain-containing protein [Bacteroidota bacterium]WHZ09347.1 MAG: Bis-ABC ATPase Uup [Cytophagales bacterium]